MAVIVSCIIINFKCYLYIIGILTHKYHERSAGEFGDGKDPTLKEGSRILGYNRARKERNKVYGDLVVRAIDQK